MTTSAIKLLALVFMLADHIGEFLPGMPIFLRYIGRLSAPLFLFCAVWGFSYTRSRKKYMLRLYICGIAMALADMCCSVLAQHSPSGELTNNIFTSILAVVLTVHLTEETAKGSRRAKLLLMLYILSQPFSSFVCLAVSDSGSAVTLIAALTVNVLSCEGGLWYVLMGIAMYYVKEDRLRLSLTFAAFSALMFVSALSACNFVAADLMEQGYQWLMILALPFMLSYNGKKGFGLKYLFYVFYPVHIIALYMLGSRLT